MQYLNFQYRIIRELPHLGREFFEAESYPAGKFGILHLIPAGPYISSSEISEMFHASRRLITRHCVRLIDAGEIVFLDGRPVQGAGFYTFSTIIGKKIVKVASRYQKPVNSEIVFTMNELASQGLSLAEPGIDSILRTDSGFLLQGPYKISGMTKPDLNRELARLTAAFKKHPSPAAAEMANLDTGILKSLDTSASFRQWQSDFYSEPTSWLLGREDEPRYFFECIEYCQKRGWHRASIRGMWDNGFSTIMNELAVDLRIAGNHVIEIDLFTGDDIRRKVTDVSGGESDPLIEKLTQLSPSRQLVLMFRIDPFFKYSDWAELDKELDKIAFSNVFSVLCSQEPPPFPCDYSTIQWNRSIGLKTLTTRYCRRTGDKLAGLMPGYSSSFEIHQAYIQKNTLGAACTVNGPESSASQPFNLLPGLTLETAISVPVEKHNLDFTTESAYRTTSRSGTRIWPFFTKTPVKRPSDEMIEAILQKNHYRLFELEWLINRYSRPSPQLETAFLKFWQNSAFFTVYDELVNLLESSPILTASFSASTVRTIVMDLKNSYTANSRDFHRLWQCLEHCIENSILSTPSMRMLKAVALKSQGNLDDSFSEAFSLLEETRFSSEYAEELVEVCTVFTRTNEISAEARSRADKCMKRLIARLSPPSAKNLHKRIVLIWMFFRLWFEPADEEAREVFEAMVPPDDLIEPENAFNYYTLSQTRDISYKTEGIRKCFNHATNGLYMQRSTKPLSATSQMQYNIMAFGDMLGKYTASEFQQSTQRIAHAQRDNQSSSVMNVFYNGLCCVSIFMFNIKRARQYADVVASHSEALRPEMRQIFALNLFRLSLTVGDPEEAYSLLNSFDAKEDSTDFDDLAGIFRNFMDSTRKGETRQDSFFSSDLILRVLVCNHLLSKSQLTKEQWLQHLRKISEDTTSTEMLADLRGGKLLCAYCKAVALLAGNSITVTFLEKQLKLLEKLDAAYRDAGLILINNRQTPMEIALECAELNSEEIAYASAANNPIYNYCKELCIELNIDFLFILRQNGPSIEIIGGYPEKNVPFDTNRILEVIHRLKRMKHNTISIPGILKAVGISRSSISAVRIEPDPEMSALYPGSTLFVVAESVSPGITLNRKDEKVLSSYAGILALLANRINHRTKEELDPRTGFLTSYSWMQHVEMLLSENPAYPAALLLLKLECIDTIQACGTAIDLIRELKKQLGSRILIGRFGAVHFAAILPFINDMQLDAEITRINNVCKNLRSVLKENESQLLYKVQIMNESSGSLISVLAQAAESLGGS